MSTVFEEYHLGPVQTPMFSWARPEILLGNDFGTVLIWFRRRAFPVLCKQFDENEHFSSFEFSSAGIKIGVWVNSGGLNSLGRP